MASYDPQARRSRPPPSEQSPVDDLLGAVDSPQMDQVETDPLTEAVAGDSQPEEDGSGINEDRVRPFDTPPVEVADERADLVHRFGVLAAVAGLVAVLALRHRRRRTD